MPKPEKVHRVFLHAWRSIKRYPFFVITVGLLLTMILLPVVRLVISSFQIGHPAFPEGWSWQSYIYAFSLPAFRQALRMTIVLATAGTIITLSISLLFAWLIERTDLPLRNLAWSLILIPMAVPGVLFALSWGLLLGPNAGALNRGLRFLLDWLGIHLATGPVNIYSLAGLIFLDGLNGVTTVFLMVVGSFRMMDPALEEAARVSGAGRIATFFRVTLPVLAPAIILAAMYRFVAIMEAFEIPLAIGLPANIFVLSTLIYFTARLQVPVDYGLSAAFGVLFMFIMIILIVFYRYGLRHFKHFATVTGKGYRPRVMSLGKWRYPALSLFVVYFVLTVLAPMGILAWASLLPSYRPPSFDALKMINFAQYIHVLSTTNLWQVTWNTLLVMIITATITMAMSLIVSWIIIRTNLRYRGILDALMFLPYSVPGIVIALALIMAFLSPPLRYLNLYGTVWLICMGLMVHYIAFGTRLMNGAIIQIHRELEEAAYMSSATAFRTLFQITLPLLFPAFAAGWIWVTVHALRSFSIPLMLGSRKNFVFSVLLWRYWNDGDIPIAAAMGVMLILALIPLTLLMRRFVRGISEVS